ncbi:flavodoxin family protein [Sphingomonas sp.]|jgi:hypothetical protein|uniref:flavodoxin family protein n=1 Tax=Sphingomonas sp. TaxID=28214 RepID=UPI002DEF3767|nr:NAD(P)H-dependent oxidoreductase [Sphingomonas sp.]HEV2567925.1 NAD(P)H-dependent oxidoreductase [Sphingomonas sp.]
MGSCLVILASARSRGNTAIAVERLASRMGRRPEVADMCRMNIVPFSYGSGDCDDVARLRRAISESSSVVFATPVYWYAMSALLKTLLERLGDPSHQPPGAGTGWERSTWLIATGGDPVLPLGFEVPLIRAATAMRMHWGGTVYVRSHDGEPPQEDELRQLDGLGGEIEAPPHTGRHRVTLSHAEGVPAPASVVPHRWDR